MPWSTLGANDRKPERHVDRVAKADELHRDGRLIVVHRDHRIVGPRRALRIAVSAPIGPSSEPARVSSFKPAPRGEDAGLDSSRDLFVAQQPLLAGVRIERRDRHPGSAHSQADAPNDRIKRRALAPRQA